MAKEIKMGIGIELDITITKKLITEYARVYNDRLSDSKILSSCYQDHRLYLKKSALKETKKSVSIKNSHIQTAHMLINAFYKHINNNIKHNRSDRFIVNSEAIARLTGQTARTTRRHISKLKAVNFIENTVFRGSRTGYEMEINPEFIVMRTNKSIEFMVLKGYNSQNISKEQKTAAITARISYSDTFNGMLWTSCPHIKINKLNYKNNIIEGIVNINSKFSQMKNIVSIDINNELNNVLTDKKQNKKTEHSCNRRSVEETKQIVENETNKYSLLEKEILNKGEENGIKISTKSMKIITSFIKIILKFAIENIKFSKEVTNKDIQLAEKELVKEFVNKMSKDSPKQAAEIYENMLEAIMLSRENIRKRPEFQIFSIALYFSPNFSGGFFRIYNEWIPNVLKRRRELKNYNSNNKMLARAIRKYLENENDVVIYQKIAQYLGKKKDQRWLNLFNQAVIDPNKYYSGKVFEKSA